MKDAQFQFSPPLVGGGMNNHKGQDQSLYRFVNLKEFLLGA